DAVAHAAAERRGRAVGVDVLVPQGEGRPARAVPAVAAIQRDLELADRPEALLDDRLRPVPKRRIGLRVLGGVGHREAGLEADGEPDAVLDARDAPLAVDADELERLRIELGAVLLRGERRVSDPTLVRRVL